MIFRAKLMKNKSAYPQIKIIIKYLIVEPKLKIVLISSCTKIWLFSFTMFNLFISTSEAISKHNIITIAASNKILA